jgi:folate-binding protein YgfZ
MTIHHAFASGPAAVVHKRGIIRAGGTDAEAFLQGQLSQDISRLAPGESAWSLLLQPQGKVDAWLRVTRIDATTFLLDVDPQAVDGTLKRLNRFKLRTVCDLDADEWSIVSIRGAGAAALEVSADSGAEVVVPAEWPGIEGIDLLGPAPTVPAGVGEASIEDLEVLRILAGVPAMGSELTERTIPAEAGIVERSVSFTKGCFTGQELVARIDSRGGNVPRHLRGVVGDGALVAGSSIRIDDAEVGIITSVSANIGLAYVKRAVESFPAAAHADAIAVELRELPLL